MAVQLSIAVRNARLEAIETTTGTSAILRMYTGAQPANCGTAEAGTLLVSYSLASDWSSAASAGAKALSSLPLSVAASGTGSLGHWRIWDTAVANCHAQGSITATGGGGDMTVDNISVASAQVVNVTAFTLTDGNV